MLILWITEIFLTISFRIQPIAHVNDATPNAAMILACWCIPRKWKARSHKRYRKKYILWIPCSRASIRMPKGETLKSKRRINGSDIWSSPGSNIGSNRHGAIHRNDLHLRDLIHWRNTGKSFLDFFPDLVMRIALTHAKQEKAISIINYDTCGDLVTIQKGFEGAIGSHLYFEVECRKSVFTVSGDALSDGEISLSVKVRFSFFTPFIFDKAQPDFYLKSTLSETSRISNWIPLNLQSAK